MLKSELFFSNSEAGLETCYAPPSLTQTRAI